MTVDDVTDRTCGERRQGTTVVVEANADPDADRHVRSAVRHCFGLVERQATNEFLTAVTEVLTNAVDEHRRLDCDEPIRVEIDAHRLGGPQVSIIDRGEGVDLAAELASVRPDDDRGRGLVIATTFVPDLSVHRSHGRTVVRLPLATAE